VIAKIHKIRFGENLGKKKSAYLFSFGFFSLFWSLLGFLKMTLGLGKLTTFSN
jgi:hypothetical protein